MPKGEPDMQSLLRQAQQMQSQLMSLQDQLAEETVEGHAGGGLVRAEVSGTGELRSVTIDPSAVDPQEVETLQDLIVAAVRDGSRAARELAESRLGPLTGGLPGLGLPGG